MAAVEDTVQTAVDEKSLSEAAAKNLSRWLTAPAYAEYRPKIQALLETAEFDTLEGLFWEIIPFGTGGRRGRMSEFGTATINERTIAESADGLARYLIAQKGDSGLSAVVACDTRNRSSEFARLTARVFAGRGVRTFLFDDHRSTPELSFAVRHLGCDIGAMISASHNPPGDNGFKAYWSHGGQVLSPHDKGIINCVYEAGEIPLADFEDAVNKGLIEIVGESIDNAYFDAVLELSLTASRSASAVFTPLHGVGGTSVWTALERANFANIQLFEPQASPDGNFSNVPDHLPNPERKEVFGPAIESAGEADLILASDPDADRLGVAVRDSSGEFRILSGNQVGALICDYVLAKRADNGSLTPEHYIVETMVTTPLIGAIGDARGVQVIDNLLVGFKYIGEEMDLNGPERFVFGAEESLGYLAGEYARDKDATIAALYVMELASELKDEGRTLLDRLDELFTAHGYYFETQKSEVCPGPRGAQQIQSLMTAFRESPPTSLGRVDLELVRDYEQHEMRELPGNDRAGDLPEPQGNLLFFESAEADGFEFSFAARPSGTEPKIKFYLFAKADVKDEAALPTVKEQTAARVDQCTADLSAWIQRQLDA